jgi:uncharacterized protein (TIGR00730 family)
MNLQQVCVYCSSSNQIPIYFFEAARALAIELVQSNITLVYGGGTTGLMGIMANEMMAKGGKVIGIIPDFMKQVEWAHEGITELHIVGDMHERKKKFLDGTDALIALPGGCGTLEELLEAITLKRLGLFTKPIIILNYKGFYDPLLAQLKSCIDQRFMNEDSDLMWQAVSQVHEIIPAIRQAPPWHEDAIRHASLK